MAYQFEKLEVWQVALHYLDLVYELSEKVSKSEILNIKSQIAQAAYRILKNIAFSASCGENRGKAKFIDLALQAVAETVTCYHVIYLRNYLNNPKQIQAAYEQSESLSTMLLELKFSLEDTQNPGETAPYLTPGQLPFEKS
jgi:four helix bundle protein